MAIRRKTGGRTKGTPNKASAAKAAAIAVSGLTPLDFAIATMRRYAAKAEAWEQIADDETATPSERAEAAKTAREYTQFAMDAAKTAAPYAHPKLTAIAPPEPGLATISVATTTIDETETTASSKNREAWRQRLGTFSVTLRASWLRFFRRPAIFDLYSIMTPEACDYWRVPVRVNCVILDATRTPRLGLNEQTWKLAANAACQH